MDASHAQGALMRGEHLHSGSSYKRLDKGVFRLPIPLDEHATSVLIDERALDDLLDGIDVDLVRPRPPRRERVH